MVAWAVAMGIGRFALPPIMPMMLNDGVVDLPGASWLASANYLGYMLGALLCTLQPWIWSRLRWLPLLAFSSLVRAGLIATGVLTLAMAWQFSALWPALRFAAGLTSAVVFVYTSGWCLSQLSRRGVPAMGGISYAGPGAGIVVRGALASGVVAWPWTARVVQLYQSRVAGVQGNVADIEPITLDQVDGVIDHLIVGGRDIPVNFATLRFVAGTIIVPSPARLSATRKPRRMVRRDNFDRRV